MRYEKWITTKQMIILDRDENGGYLKILDYRKNKTDKFIETVLARW